MKILIVDDMKERQKQLSEALADWYLEEETEIVFVDNKLDAIKELKKKKEFDLIFLDHDLGGPFIMDSNEDNTGYQVARFIRNNNIKYGRVIVHTVNPAGAFNICSILKGAERVPFPYLIDFLKNR